MKLIDKLKKQVNAAAKVKPAKKGEKRLLFVFKEEHYKKEMSSAQGFGSQDLKPSYLELYTYLLAKYKGALITEVSNPSKKEVSVYIK